MANQDYFKAIFDLDGKRAEAELEQMQQKAGVLAEKLEQARKANDLITFNKTKKELNDLDREIGKYKKNVVDVKKTLDNLNGASLNDLTAAQRKITAELSKMERGTKEYVAASKQLQLVDAEVKKVKNEMRAAQVQQESWMSKASNGFNKYFALIGAMAASFTGVVFGARKMIDSFNEFESKLDELSALTGLAGDDLNWLGEEAKRLSISTDESGIRITASATEILDAYKLMGSAKPELLKNKEALNDVTKQALILAEAAKMETAPAVTALANIMNQFGAPAKDAAKYVNILAAGSKEGAAEVEDLSDAIIRSGAAATQANVSIEQEVALVETLAEKGVKAERAGTGLRGAILKLQKGADEYNPKVVGMSKALENLAAKNLSAKQMMELFGEESYTVASILINNRQRFDQLTTAVTDTNVAYEQAAINTDNNSAKLEQAKNKAQLTAIAFGEKLAPALTFSTNGVTYFLKAMMATISFFSSNIKIITTITAGIIAYTVAVNAQTIATKAYTLATQFAEKVTKLFNTTTKSSPWGWLAAGVVAVITALALYSKRTTDAAAAQKMLNEMTTEAKKSIAGEKIEIERLLTVARDEKKSKDERLAAIKKLNEISPKYLGNLNLENINTTAAKKATEEYIAVLEKKALVQAANEKLVEIEKEFIDLKEQGTEAESRWYQTAWNTIASMGNMANMASLNTKTVIGNYNKAFEELAAKKKALLGILAESPDAAPPVTPETPDANASTGGSSSDGKKKDLEKIRQAYADLYAAVAALENEANAKSQTAREKELAAIETKFEKELDIVGNRYNEGIITQQEADDLAIRLEDAKGQQIFNLNQKWNEEDAIAEAKRFEDKQKAEEEFQAKRNELRKQYEQMSVDELEALEISSLQEIYIQGLFNEEEYQAAKQGIVDKYNGIRQQKNQELFTKMIKADIDALAIMNAAATTFSQTLSNLTEASAIDIETSYQEQTAVFNDESDKKKIKLEQEYQAKLKAAGDNEEQIKIIKEQYALDSQNLETQISNEKTKLDKKFADQQVANQKKMAKIQLLANIAKIASEAATGIMTAWATFGWNPATSWIAVAQSALIGGIALSQGIVAKAQYNQIMAQKAKGKYDVIGAEDGKHYNAEYTSSLSSGLVRRPTLVAEEPEIVMSIRDTRFAMMNYPQIIGDIQQIRHGIVPQRAEGNYGAIANTQQGASGVVYSDPELKLLLADLRSILPNIRAYYNDKEVENITKRQKVNADIIEAANRYR